MKAFGFSVTSLCETNIEVAQALMELAAIGDEACGGVGLAGHFPAPTQNFYVHADQLLEPNKRDGSTLCEEIEGSRIRVLPKMRTPQTGLTIRSLSHNLAICYGHEIQPHWIRPFTKLPDERRLNLLIVPWPTSVAPVQFVEVKPTSSEMRNMPKTFGFFSIEENRESRDVVDFISKLHRVAGEIVGETIHGVVLPEAAISPKEHKRLRNIVLLDNSFLITGVGSPSKPGKGPAQNCVHFDLPLMESLVQAKHHRWRLDRAQIRQYGLGHRLDPNRIWWEHICLQTRSINFVSVSEWLVMSVLICEDLARPDPVGDLVRAVGPNFVVALLMDGPQLKDRWGARYAASLADDPGCSVLTVTSLGMATLSNPYGSSPRSRVVALWKDAKNGATEIEIPAGYDAVVLSVTVEPSEEWSADGRSDEGATGYPLLSGIYPVKIASNT